MSQGHGYTLQRRGFAPFIHCTCACLSSGIFAFWFRQSFSEIQRACKSKYDLESIKEKKHANPRLQQPLV